MSTDYLAPNVRDALDIAYATVRARRPDTGGTLATLKAAKAANDDRAAAIVTFLADCEVREYTDTDVALAMLAELYAHLTGKHVGAAVRAEVADMEAARSSKAHAHAAAEQSWRELRRGG